MYLTWLDSNSWLIEMGGQRILLDPWLVGSLVFGNMPWLLKGNRSTPCPIPQNIDLILLSQGLEDHAHPPTLMQLDRSIPVVASPSAAKVVQQLGYGQVTALKPGECWTLADAITIRATSGSAIGPFTVENGYLLEERSTNYKLYYEPHGAHSAELEALAPVDVVIAPIIDLGLPVVGSIIQGRKSALQVARWLRPQVMLPTAAGADITFEGALISLLKTAGSLEELQTELAHSGLTAKVLEPKPGDRFEVPLQHRALA